MRARMSLGSFCRLGISTLFYEGIDYLQETTAPLASLAQRNALFTITGLGPQETARGGI